MKPKFLVSALCGNPRCETRNFTTGRPKATYIGSDEREHPIAKLVCPQCRMWGDVQQIEEVK